MHNTYTEPSALPGLLQDAEKSFPQKILGDISLTTGIFKVKFWTPVGCSHLQNRKITKFCLIISKADVTPAILSRDFVARLYRAIKSQHVDVQLHAATLLRKQATQTGLLMIFLQVVHF